MSDEIKLERKRSCECRECGYLISETLLIMAAHDYPCPRCERSTISQFKTVEVESDEQIQNSRS